MKFASRTYYEILDVDPAASPDEVGRAYRMVRRTFTPGSLATYSLYSPDESALIRSKIEEAYRILTDPQARARYDGYLRFMQDGLREVSTPAEFWQKVEPTPQAAPSERALLEELIAAPAEAVEEDIPQAPRLVAQGGGRAVWSMDMEKEWEEVIAEQGPGPEVPPAPRLRSSLPGEVAGGRSFAVRASSPLSTAARPAPPPPPAPAPPPAAGAADTTPGGRPLAAGGAAFRGWSRPFKAATPAPAAPLCDEKPVSAEVVAALEATYGLSGMFFEKVRLARGLSIEVIAERTKIGINYLRCIELEQFEDLPPAVYLRGFVAQYVKLLKLDAARCVDGYMARFEAAMGAR